MWTDRTKYIKDTSASTAKVTLALQNNLILCVFAKLFTLEHVAHFTGEGPLKYTGSIYLANVELFPFKVHSVNVFYVFSPLSFRVVD